MAIRTYCVEPASIPTKLGRQTIMNLRKMAYAESIKRQSPVTITCLIKEALQKAYPDILGE
jgi:hypothetical protein